tara:strand:+ start:2871 stop:3305 length:435 start_codon:yes stop_codon:yes gene_type:complete
MAITFQNDLQNILTKLSNVIKSEFGGSMPVFIGREQEGAGTQYLRIEPKTSSIIEYQINAQTRSYQLDLVMYFKEKDINERALNNIIRFATRLEYLVHDNIAITLEDNTKAFDCRIESTEYDSDPDNEDCYVVTCEFVCTHMHF